MNREERSILTARMADKLPTLRKELGVSQQALADKAGLSRSTITKVESRHQALTWSTYLALLMIFKENPETDKLLRAFGIYTDEEIEFLSGKTGTEA